MKKTVEVEYVGIEDVQDIMDDAYALMLEGHYANVEMSNITPELKRVSVNIIIGGWGSNKNSFDYSFSFYMSESETDVAAMNECKHTLKSLLEEE